MEIRQIRVCTTCLSNNRTTRDIRDDKICYVYSGLMSACERGTASLCVCWECEAFLRRCLQFRRRAERAYKASGEFPIELDSMSSLQTTIKTSFDVVFKYNDATLEAIANSKEHDPGSLAMQIDAVALNVDIDTLKFESEDTFGIESCNDDMPTNLGYNPIITEKVNDEVDPLFIKNESGINDKHLLSLDNHYSMDVERSYDPMMRIIQTPSNDQLVVQTAGNSLIKMDKKSDSQINSRKMLWPVKVFSEGNYKDALKKVKLSRIATPTRNEIGRNNYKIVMNNKTLNPAEVATPNSTQNTIKTALIERRDSMPKIIVKRNIVRRAEQALPATASSTLGVTDKSSLNCKLRSAILARKLRTTLDEADRKYFQGFLKNKLAWVALKNATLSSSEKYPANSDAMKASTLEHAATSNASKVTPGPLNPHNMSRSKDEMVKRLVKQNVIKPVKLAHAAADEAVKKKSLEQRIIKKTGHTTNTVNEKVKVSEEFLARRSDVESMKVRNAGNSSIARSGERSNLKRKIVKIIQPLTTSGDTQVASENLRKISRSESKKIGIALGRLNENIGFKPFPNNATKVPSSTKASAEPRKVSGPQGGCDRHSSRHAYCRDCTPLPAKQQRGSVSRTKLKAKPLVSTFRKLMKVVPKSVGHQLKILSQAPCLHHPRDPN